ncbi:MAG: PAC2 family protein [Candidatus Bathyarchaeia archaeon]
MEIRYLSEPDLDEPSMVAAWPGMGYLAKISADYLRRRLRARPFAEIIYYQNAIVYKDGLARLRSIMHRFYSAPQQNLIFCIGEAQPSIPEEAYRLARCVVGVAERFNVRRIYTMAAYPGDYQDEPQVYGVYTDEGLRDVLLEAGVQLLDGEGAVNGLNGVLIGVAKNRGIEGICLMGEIRYANVPQHLSSKAVLERLTAILGFEIDTSQLERRAERVEASIRRRLSEYPEAEEPYRKEEEKFKYIS